MYQRDPNGSTSASGYPISRTFAYTILASLVGLAVLRHLFGSVRLEAGVR